MAVMGAEASSVSGGGKVEVGSISFKTDSGVSSGMRFESVVGLEDETGTEEESSNGCDSLELEVRVRGDTSLLSPTPLLWVTWEEDISLLTRFCSWQQWE